MFMHNKRLMYTVRVSEPNPTLASLFLEQFGGPQGELAAAMRYFTQAISEDDAGRKDMLLDIATEELSHLEIIGSMIVMLTKGVKGRLAEGAKDGELLAEITKGGESHTLSLLYGGGAALVNSAGAPWTAAYVDTIGEPTCDLRSNIAAEARAKIIYERLINVTDDASVKEALGFLMTREIAHQKAFEKALYAIEPNFPPGKLPGQKDFVSKYFNLSQGDGGDVEGPWNSGPLWERIDDRERQAAVDGGDGSASVKVSAAEKRILQRVAERTHSRTDIDPPTGAELGAKAGDVDKAR
ncbi:MAG TPA: manganese catalase family protein [Stellaceae bacterium]|nr:manganese catalase family protein [Stellaceae bacterium]